MPDEILVEDGDIFAAEDDSEIVQESAVLVAVNDMIDKVQIILHDTTPTRWLDAELVLWATEAEKFIVARKLDAYVRHETFSLAEGLLHSISDAILILEIIRNMGTDGETPGDIITPVKRRDMDLADPTWPTATASSTIKHWIYDERNPRRFFSYPQVPSGGTQVEGIWSAVPPVLETGKNINLNAIYEPTIENFMLFRAYSKDAASHPLANQRAVGYLSSVLTSLGSQENVETLYAAMTKE